jgi:GTP cyclohydrolase I
MDREAAALAIEGFLRALGLDPKREPELAGTGARVAAAFADELCDGYAVDVAALLAKNVLAMTAAAESSEIVIVRDLPVTTMCPHHLMPAMGVATVAFAPRKRLVGLGAIAELVDAYAHRLTLQEVVGERVVAALMEHVQPAWAGCRLLLLHSCVVARGGRKHGVRVETVALPGTMDAATRAVALQALGVGA